jgi:hypothetical protein
MAAAFGVTLEIHIQFGFREPVDYNQFFCVNSKREPLNGAAQEVAIGID